ncbi:hypothetical protein IWX90DRAFT_23354 [Phyllosticta citrichinensis]|uniref:Uncharacterized protein n=1 Tax=Phyllosticta citrichinensis TaxID=1130410 RepID=A0ABR1Y775_9PEZI
MNRAKYRWTCVRASYGEGMLTDSRRMVVVSCFERSFTRLCFCILGAICSSYRSRRTDRGKDGTLLTFCKVSSSSSLTKYLRTSTTVLPTPTPTPTETETNPLVPTNHQRPSRAAAWSRATARQVRFFFHRLLLLLFLLILFTAIMHSHFPTPNTPAFGFESVVSCQGLCKASGFHCGWYHVCCILCDIEKERKKERKK